MGKLFGVVLAAAMLLVACSDWTTAKNELGMTVAQKVEYREKNDGYVPLNDFDIFETKQSRNTTPDVGKIHYDAANKYLIVSFTSYAGNVTRYHYCRVSPWHFNEFKMNWNSTQRRNAWYEEYIKVKKAYTGMDCRINPDDVPTY
jgi:hypothetical protein